MGSFPKRLQPAAENLLKTQQMPEQLQSASAGSKVGLWSPFQCYEDLYSLLERNPCPKPLGNQLDFSLFGGAESLWEGKQRAPRRTEVPRPTDKDDGKS